MNRQQQILALLVAKFPGARKDGLDNLARTIAGVTETEDEAKAMVDKIKEDKIKEHEQSFRSFVDSEAQKAAATREDNLRKAYDLVEKGKPTPPIPPAPPTPEPNGALSAEAIAKMVSDGINAGLKPFQEKIAAMEAKNIADVRRGKLVDALGQVPDAYKDAIVAAFNAQTFADDAAFDTYVEQQKTAATSLANTLAQSQLGYMGGIYNANGQGGDGKGVSAAVQSFINDNKAEAKPTAGKQI